MPSKLSEVVGGAGSATAEPSIKSKGSSMRNPAAPVLKRYRIWLALFQGRKALQLPLRARHAGCADHHCASAWISPVCMPTSSNRSPTRGRQCTHLALVPPRPLGEAAAHAACLSYRCGLCGQRRLCFQTFHSGFGTREVLESGGPGQGAQRDVWFTHPLQDS
jgi:hypothetical protein